MLKILIADDHRMFRDGVIAILEKENDIEIVGEAGNAQEVFDLLSKNQIDIILMDVSLGNSNGIEITKTLRPKYDDIKIIFISMHSESNYVMSALELGAAGYLLKDAGKMEMLAAIRAVANGGTYYGKKVSQILMEHLQRKNFKTHKEEEKVTLTRRELEVLKLLASEFSNQEIAEKLFISSRTVDTHRRNLLEKLKLKNNAGLVRYALRNGLTEQ